MATSLSSPSRPPRNLWPVAIIGFFAVFIVWIAGFIVFSTFHRVDLVSPDYYAQELRHQEQIDRRERAQALPDRVRITYDAARQNLTLTLPIEHALLQPVGVIHFYRPSAAGLDQKRPLDVGSDGRQVLDARQLDPGLWRVRVQWTVEGRDYFAEQEVVISPAKASGAQSPAVRRSSPAFPTTGGEFAMVELRSTSASPPVWPLSDSLRSPVLC